MTMLQNRPNSGVDGSTLVALPVFNEACYLEDVLRAVRRYASNVLVVNDGSTDGTGDLLKKQAVLCVLTHEANHGYGRSLIDAFAHARQHEFAWVVTMDCDHQHEPGYLPRFYREIEKDDTDIISGSRYLRRIDLGTIAPPPDRVAINRTITALLNRHLGLHLTDAFCGFKAYRLAALARLALTDAGYGLPLQLWVQASRAGLRVREIPVPLIYHDCRRNFAGGLEDPRMRMAYYLGIIERELGFHVRDETETVVGSPEHREYSGGA
jgi:dolichol-phosphate mannosyltransferase